MASVSASDDSPERNDLRLLIKSSIGATLTNQSSCPVKCAAALLQGCDPGSFTNPALTGLSSTYLAAASKYLSSMGYEANRPCHRWPRHPSRKLMSLEYLLCASPIAPRNPSSEEGTIIRCTWLGIRQEAHTATAKRAHHSAIRSM
jgi:hypothetical protein